jgi:hypothetical protein
MMAFALLLIQGSAVGAYTLLDGAVAARANATAAHVEESGGRPSCVGHDEATCQLCRAGTSTVLTAAAQVVIETLVRAERPSGRAAERRNSTAHPALHSRAPPLA